MRRGVDRHSVAIRVLGDVRSPRVDMRRQSGLFAQLSDKIKRMEPGLIIPWHTN